MLARASKLPTGTVVGSLLAAAPAGALLLDGSAPLRATYPVLWQWVQDNGLVKTGLFTTGNGSTTFGLPDFRGRVLVGGGSLAPGTRVGSDTIALTTAQIPGHTHTFNTDYPGTHGHNGTTSYDGNHGGHCSGAVGGIASTGGPLSIASDTHGYPGDHYHGFGTSQDGNHNHSGTTDSTGSGSAIDVRQNSVAVNWIIWT